jgi:hypothetical protein
MKVLKIMIVATLVTCSTIASAGSFNCFDAIKAIFAKRVQVEDGLNYETVHARYLANFDKIFEGIDSSELKSMKVEYDRLNGAMGETDLLSHVVYIDSSLKKHPASILVQIHEAQHYYDIKKGRLKCLKGCGGHKVSYAEIVDSEIRAHYRHLKAMKILFTDEELNTLLLKEKNPVFKKHLADMVEHANSPHVYIAKTLYDGGYLNSIAKACDELKRNDLRNYLVERIEKIIDEIE